MCSNCAGDYQDPDRTALPEEREEYLSGIARVCAVPECIRVARVQCDVCNAMVCKEHIQIIDNFEFIRCELCNREIDDIWA